MTAREEGAAAWKAGKEYSANPYSLGESFTERLKWAGGWRGAREAETKRQNNAFNRTYDDNARRRGQYE